MRYLTIALTKGRLAEKTLDMLDEMTMFRMYTTTGMNKNTAEDRRWKKM